ncbi:ArsR family transcriptional regulator [Aminobacter lissarensis]|uniref:ArsR family transcriptional regulator n=1 Tax=Aminobacter carboxidus TaxID=376165 RepID=A0A8E1WEE3_9HYPH|nr:winged helix-turn-helix domain-containing protein [Aminobacter lissarensis]MBB6466031.1 ArsR family transcriptional regulator [Aminobacter lissarensis]
MDIKALKAIACESRLKILEYLKDPTAHFESQDGFDVAVDGVWNKLIARKLAISQESVTAHMRCLVDAGLVKVSKVGTHRLYTRDHDRITTVLRETATVLGATFRNLETDVK